MSGRLLRLVPVALGPEDRPHLSWLGARLGALLALPTVEADPLPLAPDWLEPDGRCASNHLVDALIHRDPLGREGRTPRDWTLAVTAADLFADGRDFVFGEAARGGAWAVLGLARLRSDDDPDDRALRRRALTEALHELGHLAGLDHCPDPACAMAAAADLADVDRKENAYCPDCGAAVTSALDPSPERG